MTIEENIRNIVNISTREGRIYFIGIGGIGMSALARYFHSHGKKVSGFDKTETSLTRQLVSEGIAVHYEENPDSVPRDADLVVYTPAISQSNRELQFYLQHDFPLLKRSDVLGLITENSFNICVAGTHGKTTVSTMIAHILRHSGYGCNAFLGGISVNYQVNSWSNEKNVCVVEADEYDRSFLKLKPDIAVITAMDADHLDIYGTEENVQAAFTEFSGKIKRKGTLLFKMGLPLQPREVTIKHISYHVNDTAARVHATGIRIDKGSYVFHVVLEDLTLKEVVLNMGGLHNVENAVAAVAVAHELKIDPDKIRKAVADFKGVKRRFEVIVKTEGIVFIDDYAHHPEELRALIAGVKTLFAGRKCLIIFQPHLFTRTRDFVDGFAESLGMADEVLLLPIYPARELSIPGVESEMIAKRIKNSKVSVLSRELALERIKHLLDEDALDVLITAGAGDIDTMVQPIGQMIAEHKKEE